MFLARKITRAKWDTGQELSAGEISADAVTSDLRTKENTLSFWRCRTETNGDVEDAVLGFGTRRSINTPQVYEYAAKPTDLTPFFDGDVIAITGAADRGTWGVSVTTTATAVGLGLENVTWNPRTQATSFLDGDTEWVVVSRGTFRSQAANQATAWAAMPAGTHTLAFGYSHDDYSQGQIIVQATADNSYAGHIVLAFNGHGSEHRVRLNKVSGNSRQWIIMGLGADVMRSLRETMAVTFAFPDQSDFTATKTLTQFGVGGPFQIQSILQTDYDALAAKDAETIYLITG